MLLHTLETAACPNDTIVVVGFWSAAMSWYFVLRQRSSYESAGGIVAALANRQEEANYQSISRSTI
jgi:hypothetical protein